MPKRRRGQTRNKEKHHNRKKDMSADPFYKNLGNKGKIKTTGQIKITPFTWSRQNIIRSRYATQCAKAEIIDYLREVGLD